MADPPYVDGIT